MSFLSEKQLVQKRRDDLISLLTPQLRENEYFNDKDYFLLYDKSLNKFISSQVHFFNGNWYSNLGLKYKMTSVKSVNCTILNKTK